jgi:hypothetical protein
VEFAHHICAREPRGLFATHLRQYGGLDSAVKLRQLDDAVLNGIDTVAFGIGDRFDDSAREDTAAKVRSLETFLPPLCCGYDGEVHLMRIERVRDLVVAATVGDPPPSDRRR